MKTHFRTGVIALIVSVLAVVASIRADAGDAVFADRGVSKAEYLDLMEFAVQAYGDERIAGYLAEVERDGVQEHGFPRLAANLGVLLANGRLTGKRAIVERMLVVACRDAAKGRMPPKSGGNEFGVKELVLAVDALAKAGIYPAEKTQAWRASLASVVAEDCYTLGRLKLGENRARNWVVFAAASEQARIAHGLGGNAAFVEKYVADQLRWFDSNGMYRDPDQPAVYDFVTRLQFASLLGDGYDGPSRAKLEKMMELSAEPTLRMQSACGEIPYGGRSNQFLHNNTFYAALCEWYARRYAKAGDMRRAMRFRRAARKAVDALRPWLAVEPRTHVKNRYPRESGKGVYSSLGDMGCERYAYFDKYMVTMGSWAMLGWLFADESVPALSENEHSPDVFVTTPDFHWVFLRAGDYSAQVDYEANQHYDSSGLGRLQRSGAPGAICLSVPCAAHPAYRIERDNDAALAIAPVTGAKFFEFVGTNCENGVVTGEFCAGGMRWLIGLSHDGISSTLTGNGEIAMTLPAFDFDGLESSAIVADSHALTITYRGWRCRYETDGVIVDTGRTACNRNGRYRRFEARGVKSLNVRIAIERKSDPHSCKR